MKFLAITVLSTLLVSFVDMSNGEGETNKEDWTRQAITQLKLSCSRAMLTFSYNAAYPPNQTDLEGQSTYQDEGIEELLRKTIVETYSFCDCVWNTAAKRHSVKYFEEIGDPKMIYNEAVGDFDEYLKNSYCSDHPATTFVERLQELTSRTSE